MLALVLVNRSFSASLFRAVVRPNIALAAVVAVVAVVLGLAQFAPPVRTLLSFGSLGPAESAWVAATGLLVLFLLETLKRFLRIAPAN